MVANLVLCTSHQYADNLSFNKMREATFLRATACVAACLLAADRLLQVADSFMRRPLVRQFL